MRVNIIGAGKVGTTFLHLLAPLPGVSIGDLFSRRPEQAAQVCASLGAGRAVPGLEQMSPADLWLLTVPDDQITAVAQALADARQERDSPPAIAVHCSGFYASSDLAPLRNIGWSVASCHPVLSFAEPASAAGQFPGTYCGIEGEAVAVARISALMTALGGIPFPVQTEKKALYHAAAVVSNNFTVTLQGLALEIWAEAGVPDAVARDLCRSLLGNTAANVGRVGPRAALTGPAARGDTKVMRLQESGLADWDRDTADLYRLLSRMAQNLKHRGQIAGADRNTGG